MALAMQKSYDSFCSEWADFKAILVKRKDENGWTLAKVVSWSPNASITGYAKELRTLPLNWGIAVLKKEGFCRYASSMTNGQNFSMFFPLKIKIGLCVSWILLFFLSCEVLRIFLLAWDEKWTDDDESVVCPRRPPESRLRWTLNLHFSMSTRQYFRLENQALHMEMERTHEFFARGILWCAGFLRWSLLQNDELFDWKPYRLQSLTTETYWNRGWYQCGRSQLQKTPQIIPKKAQTNNPIRSLSIMTPLHRRRSRKVKVHTFLHVNVIIGQKPRQGATA